MTARLACLLLWFVASPLFAMSPRFVTGSYYANPGVPMAFYTPQLQYFTDPGAVSSTVSHAQGDSIVAAAAAVWNNPLASLQLTLGGALAEHISSRNVYLDGTGMVFPADVASTNWQAIPIAIIYDTDGSVTDLLLGEGASAPTSCRQNEVTESVDSFGTDGTIHHAMLIINGRCVTNTAGSLLQLQYVLMRQMGRVLGLGWSQLNDNVFTGSPTPTAAQMNYWPVMHPIDVVCGTYTYTCMQNPFTLREDDLASLTMLYPVTAANQRLGQTITATSVYNEDINLLFPTGEGMDGVNVIVKYQTKYGLETWYRASGMTGTYSPQNMGNPITGPEDPSLDTGGIQKWMDSDAPMRLMSTDTTPLLFYDWEPINALYTGAYAIGPAQRTPEMYAGAEVEQWMYMGPFYQFLVHNIPDGGTTCETGTNGSETAPQPADPSGWWGDTLCARQRPAWGSLTVQPGRTWTLEVTSEDGNGLVSTQKMLPVLGAWVASDPTGTLPTIAAQPVPMNTLAPGVTLMTVPASQAAASYRYSIADQYGNGRPDFQYSARVLYADTIVPATLGATGGQVTLTGMGFTGGMRILVNGVAAAVTSATNNTIVATVPSATAVAATAGIPVDVEVLDPATGSSSTITGALTYTTTGTYSLTTTSAPTQLETGVTSGTPFAVKVIAADGISAIPGARVQFSIAGGHGAFASSCTGAATCALVTGSNGVASVTLAGLSAGAVTVTATELTGGATAQIALTDSDPVRSATIATAPVYVAAGTAVSVPITFHAVQDGAAASGAQVAWSATAGAAVGASTTLTAADGSSTVAINSAASTAGASIVTACAWTSVCANWTLTTVAASAFTPAVISGAGQSVQYASALAPVVLQVTDGAGHAVMGSAVTVSQTVTAWEGTCPVHGRCASAPVLANNSATAATDANGIISVAPLTVAGVPQVVNIAVSTGSSGFLTLTLVKTP